MAEIKIEKKKPIWPWIIFVIVLVGVAYLIYASLEDDDYSDDANTDDVENINGVIERDSTAWDTTSIYNDSSYVTRDLTEVMKDSSLFGTDTTYTNRALYDLAERTLKMAKNHNIASSSAVSDLEQYIANKGKLDSQTTQISNDTDGSKHFKTVSTDIVEVIETLESNHSPRLPQQVEELKNTVSKINGSANLYTQQNTLQAFIRKAHELLNNINS